MGTVSKLVPKFESLKDIERLLDMANPQVVPIRRRPFHLQVCCPKELPQDEVEAGAGPSGTATGWTVDNELDNPVQCDDDPDRQHWVLSA